MKSVLVLDLDETLIQCDVSYEAAWQLLKRRPIYVFKIILLVILNQRQKLKKMVACRQKINPKHLPYRSEIINLIQQEKNKGRTIVLATGADQSYADEIGHHLGYFTQVFGSKDGVHLIGQNKLDLIKNHFDQFDYIGDSNNDVPLWQSANVAYIVNKSISNTNRLQKRINNINVIDVSTIPLLGLRTLWPWLCLLIVPSLMLHGSFSLKLLVSSMSLLCLEYIIQASEIKTLEPKRTYIGGKQLIKITAVWFLSSILICSSEPIYLLLSIYYAVSRQVCKDVLLKTMLILSVGFLLSIVLV